MRKASIYGDDGLQVVLEYTLRNEEMTADYPQLVDMKEEDGKSADKSYPAQSEFCLVTLIRFPISVQEHCLPLSDSLTCFSCTIRAT